MSLLDLASLVLAPTATKEGKVYSAIPDTGDGDMTFTRGSSATRINSAGLIEKERGNLLLQSNTFDTTWVNGNSNVSSGFEGYDGSNDAWKIDLTGSGGHLRQNVSYSGVNTFSIYLKAGSLGFARLLLFASPNNQVDLNLTTGATSLGSGIVANSEDVGGGWFRFSITGNLTSATRVYIYPAQAIGDFTATSGNIYIQDAMLNEGLVATDYIPTTTSAVYEGITDDVPRVDYSGGGCPALKLEPQRSNLITQSEYFNGSNWNNFSGITPITNSLISPEGVQNGSTLECSGNAVFRYSFTATASTDYVGSIFVKAKGTTNDFGIQTLESGTAYTSVFDIENGSVISEGANHTASIEDYGNGWYRCVVQFNSGTSTSNIFDLKGSQTSTKKDFYAYGAMLEAGSYSTSYIPTYGVSSTRVADSCSKTGISDVIGQTEGTLFLDVDTTNFEGDQRFGISDGTSANRIVLRLSGSLIQLSVVIGNTTQASITGSGSSGNRYKIAGVYKENDFALYINGSLAATDTSGIVSGTFSRLATDRGFSGQDFYNPIKQAILFPTRLTNDQLSELTK